MDKQAAVLPVGATFGGRYRVARAIRAGGMGAVHEVIDHTGRRRALKTMLPDVLAEPSLRNRFQGEATITANIQSEHIVEVFDAGIDAATGMPFLVMELLQGEELAATIKHRGALPATELVLYLYQASLALEKTHAAGIVHRDLKPENLFVTRRDDGSPRIKIIDFGIAKVIAQSQMAKGTQVLGTPLYMAPEQIQNTSAISPRTDLYALGHIAYTALAGAAYWSKEASNAENIWSLIAHIMGGLVEPASTRAALRGVPLPPRFDEWFGKAVARDPAQRFERASRLVAALADVLGVPVPGSGVASAVRGEGIGVVGGAHPATATLAASPAVGLAARVGEPTAPLPPPQPPAREYGPGETVVPLVGQDSGHAPGALGGKSTGPILSDVALAPRRAADRHPPWWVLGGVAAALGLVATIALVMGSRQGRPLTTAGSAVTPIAAPSETSQVEAPPPPKAPTAEPTSIPVSALPDVTAHEPAAAPTQMAGIIEPGRPSPLATVSPTASAAPKPATAPGHKAARRPKRDPDNPGF